MLEQSVSGPTHLLSPRITIPTVTLLAELTLAALAVLGKTNMSVYSNFFGQGTSSGWSPRGGQTVSPHDAALNPDGSSTGSAVALSAGWCAASIGTETFGSLVSVGLTATLSLLNSFLATFPVIFCQ
jgi:amidase